MCRVSLASLLLATKAAALKVTVVGGTGFVGCRVCKVLAESGAQVTSVSRSGTVPGWASGEAWTRAITWSKCDLLGADDAAIDTALSAPDALVSCVGVVDPDAEVLRQGNGEANARAFASAKRAGIRRSVYVSVASEVAACQTSWLPFAKDEFEAYFAGKRLAEEAAADAVGGDATKLCVLKPTFIYGGDTFELPLPGKFVAPRVTAAYGGAVEEVLSLSLFQALADALPGLIKVALRPPVSVDAVATVCAYAALGELTKGEATRRAVGTLDGTVAIKAAAGEPTPTALSDGLDRALDGLADRTEKLVKAFNEKLDAMGK